LDEEDLLLKAALPSYL